MHYLPVAIAGMGKFKWDRFRERLARHQEIYSGAPEGGLVSMLDYMQNALATTTGQEPEQCGGSV